MKLFVAFLAVAAATETTVATTTETTLANVTETTVATTTETTAADENGDEEDHEDPPVDDEGPDCAGAKEFLDNAIKGLEEDELIRMANDAETIPDGDVWTFLETYCNEVCTEEGEENCTSFSSAISCEKAQEELTATSNDVDKVDKQTACDKACADFKDETCGFLANGLSFALFALLAIFKY